MGCRDATLGPLPAAFATSLLLLMPAYQSIDSTTRRCLLLTPCDHSKERYLLLDPFTIGCKDVTLGLLPDAVSRELEALVPVPVEHSTDGSARDCLVWQCHHKTSRLHAITQQHCIRMFGAPPALLRLAASQARKVLLVAHEGSHACSTATGTQQSHPEGT